MNEKLAELVSFSRGCELINIPCILLDSEFIIRHVNTTALQLLGWTDKSGYIDNPLAEVWDKSSFTPIIGKNHTLIDGIIISVFNKHLRWRYKLVQIDDETIYILIADDVTEHENAKNALSKNYRDVTGQEAQGELSLTEYSDELKNYLESIIAQMPCYVYWKDLQFRYIGCNDLFLEEVMKVDSVSEIIGKTDYEFGWDEKIVDTYRAVDEEIIKTGEPNLGIDEIFRHEDGSLAYFRGNKMPIFNKDNKIIGLVGIAVNVTQEKISKELEQKNLLLQKQLETANAMGGSIAHELRTPLMAINGYIHLIANLHIKLTEKHGSISEELESVGISKLDIDDMGDEIEGIKELSKKTLDAISNLLKKIKLGGTPRTAFETFSITDCINEVLEQYPFKEGQRELVHFNEKKDFQVNGTPSETANIFNNLLQNAIFFILRANKGDISISINTDDPKYNQVFFKDTGPGIPEAQVPHIFEAFKSQREDGTGIGLWYCKSVMNDQGGDITCESEFGKYTKFVLYFPKVS